MEDDPNALLLPGRAPPPFIGVLGLFPQISWREGLPHRDEGGGRVHDKGGVPGRGPWQGRRHQSWKSHRPNGQLAGAAGVRGAPHGDVAFVSCCRRSPYHQSGKPRGAFAWRSFVDRFIHENGNCKLSSPLCDSAAGAEPMCVLSGRQSTLVEEEALARPRQAWDPLERKFLAKGPDLWRDLARHRSLSRLEEPGP